MTTVEEKMSHFCQTTQYWKKIDNSLAESLGCESDSMVESIMYTNQKQVVLKTCIGTILCQYYQDNPQEYCLWLIALRTEKFSVEVSYDAVFQWQNKPEDFIKYENALFAILKLATPIKIEDCAEYGASIAQRTFPYWKTTQF